MNELHSGRRLNAPLKLLIGAHCRVAPPSKGP